MATSNSTVYELTRDDIIAAAMRKCGRLAKGQTPDATDLNAATVALNATIAEFQNIHGMPLWVRTDYSLTLVAGQRDYTIGVGQTVNTPFPLTMQGVYLETSTGGSVRELQPMAYKDFRILNTESVGSPVNYSYQPKINYGVLSIWPLPAATDASTYVLQLTYQRPFQGFTGGTQTPDFPQEWQNALIYALAVNMAPEYGVPIQDRQLLKQEAKEHLDAAMMNSGEDSSMFFQRDTNGVQ